MSTDFFCKICDIPCTGKAPYDQHLISARHIKKAMLTESQRSSGQSVLINTSPSSSSSPSTLTTRSPFVTAIDTLSADSPISSASFPISAETMRILLEWNHPLDYKPYCDICQLPLYGDTNADLHYDRNNNIHHQKLAAWKRIREDDARYSCKVCSEIFANENLMREHFNSDAHADTIQQKTNLQKIIQIYEAYNKLKQVRKQSKEASAMIDDDLSNRFQSLNTIDDPSTASKSSETWTINPDVFKNIMKQMHDDDD